MIQTLQIYMHISLNLNMSMKKILDPCCGTGNFILQLPPQIPYENVYGNDVDPISVRIARINFALKYEVFDASALYEHIAEKDYLSLSSENKYDVIIGNPPWGFDFSDSQKEMLRGKYRSAVGSNIESYDVFVEQSISMLTPGGILSFVLPEAILNVKMHAPIREIMLNCSSFQYLEMLGNVFDKVQCPCIILQLKYTGQNFSSIGLTVRDGSRTYVIRQKRTVSSHCLSFSMTDEEYCIIEKMDCLQNKETLLNQSIFALGIVTGNSKKYILKNQIPSAEISGLHIKYVLAVLNSRMAQFYFMKQFHSVKVLRSHIEQIPIPAIEMQEQETVIRIVDSILTATDQHEMTKAYDALDQIIAKHYGLDKTEYQCILASVEKENLPLS